MGVFVGVFPSLLLSKPQRAQERLTILDSFDLRGVVGFTLDSSIGEYVLTRPSIECLGSRLPLVPHHSWSLSLASNDQQLASFHIFPHLSASPCFNLRIPSRGKIYSCNEAGDLKLQETGLTDFIARPTLKTGMRPSKTTSGTGAWIAQMYHKSYLQVPCHASLKVALTYQMHVI